MTMSEIVTLRELMRAALRDELPEGWFYLPETSALDLATQALLLPYAEDDDLDDRHVRRGAADRGFPREGVDTPTLVDIAQGTRSFASAPSDDLLLQALVYYLEFDAFLPRPNAPAPPSTSEFERTRDREFYDSLGPERAEVPCRKPECARGAVAYSVLCRPHHFESIRRKASPFQH